MIGLSSTFSFFFSGARVGEFGTAELEFATFSFFCMLCFILNSQKNIFINLNRKEILLSAIKKQ